MQRSKRGKQLRYSKSAGHLSYGKILGGGKHRSDHPNGNVESTDAHCCWRGCSQVDGTQGSAEAGAFFSMGIRGESVPEPYCSRTHVTADMCITNNDQEGIKLKCRLHYPC